MKSEIVPGCVHRVESKLGLALAVGDSFLAGRARVLRIADGEDAVPRWTTWLAAAGNAWEPDDA